MAAADGDCAPPCLTAAVPDVSDKNSDKDNDECIKYYGVMDGQPTSFTVRSSGKQKKVEHLQGADIAKEAMDIAGAYILFRTRYYDVLGKEDSVSCNVNKVFCAEKAATAIDIALITCGSTNLTRQDCDKIAKLLGSQWSKRDFYVILKVYRECAAFVRTAACASIKKNLIILYDLILDLFRRFAAISAIPEHWAKLQHCMSTCKISGELATMQRFLINQAIPIQWCKSTVESQPMYTEFTCDPILEAILKKMHSSVAGF
jgi:hypothetical protein